MSMKSTVKHYSNGEVTIVWKPDLCIHSGNCARGLPEVFHPKDRPWITADQASSEAIIAQVAKCPSGALSMLEAAKSESVESQDIKAECVPNGPLKVNGDVEVVLSDGSTVKKSKATFFCRCGGSSNKPFCDGAHKKNGFEG